MTANRRSTKRLAQFMFAVLASVSLFLTACHEDVHVSPDGYKTMTVRNDIASFSFEYRAYYSDIAGPRIVDSDAHRFTYVDIPAPQETMTVANPSPEGKGEMVRMYYVPAFVNIMAADASKFPMPASERIEGHISSWSSWPNFKLLERSMVMVDDAPAELIAYQVDGFFARPALKYQIDVAFDRNNLQWDFLVEADIDMAEIVRADLDHIIETFKILD
ncbi:MAG: hypothetical protein FJ025_01805 [Chloroflexi bacterium]|nr:hypothetical protein [Chloroflexota bacterium]